MTPIDRGRWTANLDDHDGVVLFLIGMRINKPWRIDQWVFVAAAMGGMLAYLAKHPESGMIKARNWFGRTTMQVAYWRSTDDLLRFAADEDAPHRPAWRRFYQRVARSSAVGIWHETYVVRPGNAEAVYVNMPAFGLAEATEKVRVSRHNSRAEQRLGAPAAEG
ncbi:DUF4188 domain-containing protein [Saccharopolyspora rhizosphaerae]|uniref:DUF4188 domain-containing protein n=1 Tax=Saccharopolyspora rhizosphaerae TaxID=2492662 RepID=A0A426JYR3_9PSEU|nr:DUF4188 domain-containing protein [Saccharopolyspora rhizosphaerae]RRO18221.1 DUF4188 domain-containing protein [Saccharopolyspora rhizosphaerae]